MCFTGFVVYVYQESAPQNEYSLFQLKRCACALHHSASLSRSHLIGREKY